MSLFPSRLFGSDPIAEQMQEFKDWCEEWGLEIKITSTRRTQAEQNTLFEQGRGAPGRIITWTRRSKHVGGRAFDFTLVGAPEYEDDPDGWELAGTIGQDLGLKWGGGFGDYGHFELPS